MDAFPQITYRDTVQKSQDSWEPSPRKKELLHLMCSRHLPTLLDRGYVECIKRQALNHMFEQDWRDYSSSWEDLSVSCSDQMFVRIRCFFFFFFPRYALQAAVQTPRSHLSTLQTDINPERHDYTWTHRVHVEDTFGMWSRTTFRGGLGCMWPHSFSSMYATCPEPQWRTAHSNDVLHEAKSRSRNNRQQLAVDLI